MADGDIEKAVSDYFKTRQNRRTQNGGRTT